MPLVCTS